MYKLIIFYICFEMYIKIYLIQNVNGIVLIIYCISIGFNLIFVDILNQIYICISIVSLSLLDFFFLLEVRVFFWKFFVVGGEKGFMRGNGSVDSYLKECYD